MAVLVAGVLAWAFFRLRSLFSAPSALLGLFCLVVHSIFLERSADCRTDMLCSLAGFISLVQVLRGKMLTAGIWAAVSFLVSQKGIYFVGALGVATVTQAALERKIHGLVRALLGGAGGLLLYFAF